jgi:hypothetical protein
MRKQKEMNERKEKTMKLGLWKQYFPIKVVKFDKGMNIEAYSDELKLFRDWFYDREHNVIRQHVGFDEKA